MGRHLHRQAQRKGAYCAVSGGTAALNRITDVIRVTSPRITLRLYAIGPPWGRRCARQRDAPPAGGTRGPRRQRQRVGGPSAVRPTPARSPGATGYAICRRGAAPGHCAGRARLHYPAMPGAPIAGRSPGRLAGPAYQHPAPPTVSGSAAPLAGHCAGQPRRGDKRGYVACGRATRREIIASRIVQAASRP